MVISALDKDTVKLITTTQVITSVSTAVKELIENALDAGAKNIEINLCFSIDNGCTLIEVKDDGCGISKVDAPYMTLSSYTSKLNSFSDLDSLETYGYRGEALHALSSVSDLTIVSKTEQDEAAISYTIDCNGHILNSKPCHRHTGTTVQVKQLFKRMPVRRQIITNSKKVINDNLIFAKPNTSSLEEAVTCILGKKITCNMDWMDITNMDIKIKMMVPLKGTHAVEVFQSGGQYIFVNDRPIKFKELEKVTTKIILEALGQESRKKPIFLIHILINAASIDVNLEPNKTCVFFKEQNMVIDIIEKHLNNFYGIQIEIQAENNCESSFTSYQDYTQEINVSNPENKAPVSQISINMQSYSDEYAERCEKKTDDLDVQLPSLDLSDSDSEKSQNFTLIYCDNDISCNTINNNTERIIEDTPPFELTPFETLSQLPIVDLGDDFLLQSSCDIDTNEKENKVENAKSETLHAENKLDVKKPMTLKEWSKGHISDLKGGTDVKPCNYIKSNELPNIDAHTNLCAGFLKFSKSIKSEVVGKNPTMTAPQIAHVMTSFWKKLSPEERGYYRDLARKEKSEYEEDKREAKTKCTIDDNKNRNRLLKAFEKMKVMNMEKKENLVMRTTVPWDINLKKVTEQFLNNSSCENTNAVVGLLRANLWIVCKSAHIWILDARNLRKKLQVSDMNTNEDKAENIEELLQQWFSVKDDLSLLHPIHSLTQISSSL
ncbi:PMS1 protein like protein 1 [Melipona quadrifasciata]|uniref:PMS1 protein like protein 1 n=1 Tax=Melipona quadrifasciata TaxID=166423 RepID=A0A0M9A8A9_9HYME|nr:PMS1 protein like protein 1 [Melipona quadrifasciata]